MNARRFFCSLSLGTLLAFGLAACSGSDPAEAAAVALHLEDRLDSAEVEGGVVNEDVAKALAWSFDAGAAGWRALPNHVPGATAAEVGELDGSLQVRLTETSRAPEDPEEVLEGGVFVDVSDFDLSEWSYVLVEARMTGPVEWVGIGSNVRETPGPPPREQWPTQSHGSGTDAHPD
jgi:hypothetical protein